MQTGSRAFRMYESFFDCCISGENNQVTKVVEFLFYYSYPSEPFADYFEKDKTKQGSVLPASLLKSIHASAQKIIPESRNQTDTGLLLYMNHRWCVWEEAFQSLFVSFSRREIPYFYFICKTFSLLFVWIKTSEWKAVAYGFGISPTMRNAMNTWSVIFKQPFESNLSSITTTHIQAITPQANANITSETKRREKTEVEKEDDNLLFFPQTTLLVPFLLFYARSSSEEPPVLYSHAPFIHGSLNRLNVVAVSKICVEISGPIMPLSFCMLQSYLSNQSFKLHTCAWNSQLGWNNLITKSCMQWHLGDFLRQSWPCAFEDKAVDNSTLERPPLLNMSVKEVQIEAHHFKYIFH